MDVMTKSQPDTYRGVRRWAVASLIVNMVIIWTGALVRLTKSGLGCPTWPQCTPESYVPHTQLGVHGAIEFGNRLLTFVLAGVAVGMWLSARRAVRDGRLPRRAEWLALGIGAGIIAQAVIGGISVLMQLNPWVVGLHMVASIALILMALELVHLAFGMEAHPVGSRLYKLTQSMFWLSMVVVLLGVVVTGAGPNSGDGAAQRNGLSLEWAAKTHAWAVWLLVVLTVLGWLWSANNARLRNAWTILLAVELLQGLIGYVQYFTSLPIALVLAHMVGTTLFVAAAGHVWRLTAAPGSGPRAE